MGILRFPAGEGQCSGNTREGFGKNGEHFFRLTAFGDRKRYPSRKAYDSTFINRFYPTDPLNNLS